MGKEDKQNKLGILGERSVQQVLYDMRCWQFNNDGWRHYEIYSTRGLPLDNGQLREIDLVEEWLDKDGKHHKIAHEVKCESLTYVGKDGYKTRKDINELLGWATHRQKLNEHAEPTKDDFEIKGTGNIFLETMQITKSGNNDGWTTVLQKTTDEVKEQYECRYVWFVQYTPKNVPDQEICEPIRQPYNYFTLLCLPDMSVLKLLEDAKRTKKEITVYKQNGGGISSKGYAVPIREIIDIDERNKDDNTNKMSYLTGKKYKAYFTQDRTVWARETKDIDEKWDESDKKIETMSISL